MGSHLGDPRLVHLNACRTGFGHPLWLETHGPASSTAPAVQRLLRAGASLRGRAHMDELAYSLNGENAHYGTPANPAAPGRIPGGSSSGSAVSAAELAMRGLRHSSECWSQGCVEAQSRE